MDQQNYQSPAFPPQVAQDNLGRLIAPVPGMSKLEYFSIQLLPTFLEIAKTIKLSDAGKPITPVQAAVAAAKQLLDELQKPTNNEKETNTAGRIIEQP